MSPRRAQRTAVGVEKFVISLLLVAGCLALLTAPFLTWLRVPTDTGGLTTVSGVGAVAGDTQLAGENLNDLLVGLGGFRPGWVVLGGGIGSALITVTALLMRGRSVRGNRVAAGLLGLIAALCAAWAVLRWTDPDPAGLLGGGSAAGGAGQIVCCLAAVLLVTGAVLLVLRPDPRANPSGGAGHRGIQPG